ncbi:MAG: type II 3-dehydroquinate dehydratase [Eggerthellaceae bacterium]|nr:type II 3-dehydroquinate dehydratase [Eggerthellaceae bacterium]
MKTFYVINGPNLNMLGIREPEIYGCHSYEDFLEFLLAHSKKNAYKLEIFQSNHEGDLVDKIQEAYFEGADGIVINPAAYTHTSIALLDVLEAVQIPTIEVHISDVSAREDFRKVSYLRQACVKTIMGHGLAGYTEALYFLLAEGGND